MSLMELTLTKQQVLQGSQPGKVEVGNIGKMTSPHPGRGAPCTRHPGVPLKPPAFSPITSAEGSVAAGVAPIAQGEIEINSPNGCSKSKKTGIFPAWLSITNLLKLLNWFCAISTS